MSLEQPEGERIQSLRRRKISRIIYSISTGLLVMSIIAASIFLIFRDKSGASGFALHTTPTATSTPTPTPTLLVPTQAIFYDIFLDNSNNWELSNQDGYIRTIVPGMLILADMNPRTTLIESLPNNNAYSDFTISVDFTIAKGDANDSTGLYLRGDNNLDHDYRIDINGNNTVDVAKEYLDTNENPETTMLYGPRSSSALRPPGQQNTLTVTMVGPQMVVMINQEIVSSLTDSDYKSGQIAVFARHGSTSDGVVVSFSRIEIDNAPLPMP